MKKINDSVRRRILALAAEFDGVEGCWEWKRYRNPVSGYGQLSAQINKKLVLFTAHRAIYEAVHGDIPEGMRVLHRCDNYPCFNPAHLFLGTQGDNMRDMWAKGRQQDYSHQPKGDNHPSRRKPECLKRGEENNKAKLTADAVREIRQSQEKLVRLAEKFGVTPTTVLDARKRKTWKHI